MNDNDRIAMEMQKEQQRREMEKAKPKKVSRSPVQEARYAWMGGTVLIDILTAYLIFQMTHYWYYAVLWFVAGAGGLLWSERLKGRIGNNSEQREIGKWGVGISAGMVVLMAALVGTVWILKYSQQWVYVTIEASAYGLFFYHLVQAYRYHENDDEIQAANDEARSEEENERGKRSAHRAARLVEAQKSKVGIEDEYRRQHGAAYDVALGLNIPEETLHSGNGSKEKDFTQPPRS